MSALIYCLVDSVGFFLRVGVGVSLGLSTAAFENDIGMSNHAVCIKIVLDDKRATHTTFSLLRDPWASRRAFVSSTCEYNSHRHTDV